MGGLERDDGEWVDGREWDDGKRMDWRKWLDGRNQLDVDPYFADTRFRCLARLGDLWQEGVTIQVSWVIPLLHVIDSRQKESFENGKT
jgi:hypothetical protein